MADISIVSRLIAGVQRGVNLGANTLVVDNLKIKMGSGNDANHAIFSGTLTAARTITMPDANVDLSDIALNTADRHSAVTLNAGASTQESASLSGQEITLNQATTSTDGVMSSEDKTKLDGIESGATADQSAAEVPYTNTTSGLTATDVQAAIDEVEGRLDTAESGISGNDTDIADLQSLSGVAANSTNLGTFTGATLGDTETIKSALQSLETAHEANAALLAGWEWQNSAIDYVTDNTLAPATEVSGDRYMLSHDGGAPNAAWDGAAAGDIVEFNGTSWVATTPTTGMVISVDDETTSLRQWSGSQWDQKFFESTTASTGLTKVGFDIQLADAATNGSGIQVSSGAITLENLTAFSTTDLSEGTNLYFTDARAIAAPITGFTSGAGALAGTDTILQAIQKLDGNIEAHIADASGAHAASAISYAGGDLTGADVEAALDDAGTRILALENEGASAESMTESLVAGETLTAGVKAVRFAKAADAVTLGRIMLADKDASSADDFYSIGLLVATGETAGASVTVTKAGTLAATAHGLTVGEPFYLDASGAVTSTAPTTTNEAVVKLGMVKDANTLEIQIQTMGVN